MPAMNLYITHALYFEFCTPPLEVIQLMFIAGYEAYVCVCFFMYKTLCAAFIWLLWDARSRSYVCLYCAKKYYIKYIYLFTTTPTSHTHLLLTTPASCSPHPLATPIHSTHSPQLSSILLTYAKFKVWMTIVESGWNVWVWLVGVGGIYGCGYWVWL